jgi:hypothetical protein
MTTAATIDFYYQGEGIRRLERIEIAPDVSFAIVKSLIAGKHGVEGDALLFLEDQDEPIDDALIVGEHVGDAGVKAHLHRCRRVEVFAIFNGRRLQHHFGPGTTVAKVKRWAATAFGMTEAEASEHVLQIAGTHNRPSPGTHVGALAACPGCTLAFHLVADQRINGRWAAVA